MKGGEVGNTISPQIGGRSGSAKPSATAHEAPGGMDAARGADDLKEISREIQARLQADDPTPSYIRSCTGTGQRSALRLAANKPTKISGDPAIRGVPRISNRDDRSRVEA